VQASEDGLEMTHPCFESEKIARAQSVGLCNDGDEVDTSA